MRASCAGPWDFLTADVPAAAAYRCAMTALIPILKWLASGSGIFAG
jgi:hypothetical protein